MFCLAQPYTQLCLKQGKCSIVCAFQSSFASETTAFGFASNQRAQSVSGMRDFTPVNLCAHSQPPVYQLNLISIFKNFFLFITQTTSTFSGSLACSLCFHFVRLRPVPAQPSFKNHLTLTISFSSLPPPSPPFSSSSSPLAHNKREIQATNLELRRMKWHRVYQKAFIYVKWGKLKVKLLIRDRKFGYARVENKLFSISFFVLRIKRIKRTTK